MRERTRLGKERYLKGDPKVQLEMTGPEIRLQVLAKMRNQVRLETASQGTRLHVLLKGENRELLKGESQEDLLAVTSQALPEDLQEALLKATS